MSIRRIVLVMIITCAMDAQGVQMPCIKWQKTFGKEKRNDYCNDALLTSQNYVVITGMSQGVSAYIEDGCFLMALDTLGAVVWQKDLEKNAIGVSLTCALNGDLFILSRYGNQSGHMIKTDSNGEVLWSKAITPIHNSLNTSNYPYHHCMTSDGNVAITGITNIDRDNYCMYLFRITGSGTVLGGTMYSYQPEFVFKEGQVLLPDSNGSVIIGGNGVYNSGTYYNAMVLKIDNNNSEIWFREYGGKLYETVAAMERFSNGDLAIATDRYSDLWEEKHLWLIRTTQLGDTLWCPNQA